MRLLVAGFGVVDETIPGSYAEGRAPLAGSCATCMRIGVRRGAMPGLRQADAAADIVARGGRLLGWQRPLQRLQWIILVL
jgi:hypothetical protein